MAGHSKWAGIKHKKAIVDARRGKLWTKLARAITVAAKEGGGDVKGNPSLALAVRRPRTPRCPRTTSSGRSTRAPARAPTPRTGRPSSTRATARRRGHAHRGDDRQPQPHGLEVRHLLSKHGGNLGEPGSVAYLFDKKGVVVVDAERWTEDDLMPAIEAGAEDIALDDDVLVVTTEPSDLTGVREALTEAGIEPESSEVRWQPKTTVTLDEDGAGKLLKLIDALEDNDDVDQVNANFDAPADVLEKVAG
jgi:transcriptional/translational regulatory protein YebC/TACO1